MHCLCIASANLLIYRFILTNWCSRNQVVFLEGHKESAEADENFFFGWGGVGSGAYKSGRVEVSNNKMISFRVSMRKWKGDRGVGGVGLPWPTGRNSGTKKNSIFLLFFPSPSSQSGSSCLRKRPSNQGRGGGGGGVLARLSFSRAQHEQDPEHTTCPSFH